MPKIQKMKIVLLAVGKTKLQYLIDGISVYRKRLKHYTQFEIFEIPNIKNTTNLSNSDVMIKEAELIMKNINSSDYIILLNSKAKAFTSNQFAKKIQSWMLSSKKRIVFLIGGSYGFSQQIYARADEEISLSKMTFSHQMIRLFFVEQLYRGYTILNHEPYHHN